MQPPLMSHPLRIGFPGAVYDVTSRGDGRVYPHAAAEKTLYDLILTLGRGGQGIQPPYFTIWQSSPPDWRTVNGMIFRQASMFF